MDMTARYVEMSNKAKEVQQKWIKASGDFFYDCKHVKVLISKGFEDSGSVSYSAVSVKCRPLDNIDYCWLPRQDQLQEMFIPEYYDSALDVMIWLWHEVDAGAAYDWDSNKAKTVEEMLLRFVMKEKYEKVWSDKKKEWS